MHYLSMHLVSTRPHRGIDRELTTPPTNPTHLLSQDAYHFLPDSSTGEKSLRRRRKEHWLYGAFERRTRLCHLPSTAPAVPTLSFYPLQPDINQVTPRGTPSPELRSLHFHEGDVRRVGDPENDCNLWGWEALRMGEGYEGRSKTRTSRELQLAQRTRPRQPINTLPKSHG